MIRVAIVGTGAISQAHLEAYRTFPERCKIVALVDIYPEKAVEKAKRFGLDCDIYDDHRKILDRDDIDLVDVCTPPYVHAEIAINALRAGKNAIVEKPMAASLAECDAMLAAARESGKLLSCIAQNRFRKPIAGLKAVLDSGLAGEVKHVQVDSFWWRGHCYYDLWWRGLWSKEGGGCTLNHAVHHIDMLGWMMVLPSEATAVLANVSHDNAEIEDLSVAVLRYPGALATVTSSVVHHGEEQQLVFQCGKARISAPWRAKASLSGGNGFPAANPALEAELDAQYAAFPELPYEGHTGQVEDVLSALEAGRDPAIGGLDGRRTIELITAIYKAGTLRQTVALPIRADDPFYTVEGMMAQVPHFYEKTASVEALGDGAITLGGDYTGKK
ncbi:MAG TPA: Gfo/Idh/MocA family oxidoreductase [Clostridia bacterium]|nr:Gfo/Idh/MocA family oxidoreductase [Clostridia bacterium]